MSISAPKLKRIKVSSVGELSNWLAKNTAFCGAVMIVTCSTRRSAKYLSSIDVKHVLEDHGWAAGRSYTLVGGLSGHVASRA